jgi:hypothetical protein
MDILARARLVAEITEQKKLGGEIAVPLKLFFEGNDDRGSIGCNLGENQPEIEDFYQTLARLTERPEVQDVWVRITDSSDDESWPYSDTIYVISSLPQSEIESALHNLMFDEVFAGWMCGKPVSIPEPRSGFAAYSIWWD